MYRFFVIAAITHCAHQIPWGCFLGGICFYSKRNEFIDKLNTMIHVNNNQENRFIRHRNAKPILAYKIEFSGKNTQMLMHDYFLKHLVFESFSSLNSKCNFWKTWERYPGIWTRAHRIVCIKRIPLVEIFYWQKS